MVLDGEENEAARVLLQEGLNGLLGLDAGGNGGLDLVGLLGFLDNRLVLSVHLAGKVG